MWLLSIKNCVEISPTPATMPVNPTHFLFEGSGDEPLFGLTADADGVIAEPFEWFMRISQGRLNKSGAVGELHLFRGQIQFAIADNNFFFDLRFGLQYFNIPMVVGLWYNIEYVILTAGTYGSSGVLEMQYQP